MKSPIIRSAARFEALEPRELRSATPAAAAVPGNDVHLNLGNDGTVVANATPDTLAHTRSADFKWYDGTQDASLSQVATEFKRGWVSNCFLQYGVAGLPANEAQVRAVVRQATQAGVNLIVIDNEDWRFDIRYAAASTVDHTMTRMEQVIGWMKDEAPQLKVGIYGYMSQSDDNASPLWEEATSRATAGQGWYNSALPDYADQFADWQATSEYLRPLSANVDYVFPALYTGTDNPDLWERSARITIEDSRRYGKPVIPFIWPKYHDAVGGGLGNTYLPSAIWQRELNLVREYADGAFIWNNEWGSPTDSWLAPTAAVSALDANVQTQSVPLLTAASFTSNDTADRKSAFSELPITI